MAVTFIKFGISQPIVKQYVAVDAEVFREMQETYSQLKSKLAEIEDLKRRVNNLEHQLKALEMQLMNNVNKKEVQDDGEDDYL